MKIKKNTKYTLGSLLLIMITTLFLTAQRPEPRDFTNPEPDNSPHPDFNGDGYADLAIGVPYEDVLIDGVTHLSAGAVQVVYGTANGLEALAANAPIDDQMWHRGVAGLDQIAADEWDLFGHALAFGDFDNDGYDDLAIGVYNSIVSGHDGAGAVHVLYGSPGGLTVQDSQVWTQNTLKIVGFAEAGDGYGSALTAGDFNKDGYDDLAVGISNESVNGHSAAGAINIIYGKASGLSANYNEFLTQDTPGIPASLAADEDRFGRVLETGDFNGDAIDDLAVGIPYEDVGVANAGSVQIFYGSDPAGILQPDGTVLNSQKIRADTPGVDNSLEERDKFGFALAAGDFNSDGFTDLAIGVPYEDIGSGAAALKDAGAVNVVFGAPGGLNPAAGAPIFHQDTPGIASYARSYEQFGFSLAAADFNNDGFADLAIGAPWEYLARSEDGVIVHDGPDVEKVGIVHILYGNASGITTVDNEILYDPFSTGQ